jgi:signal transduction histidine kinase
MSQLSLFYQVAQVMASTFDLDRVLGDILELATAILDASTSALMMIDENRGDLVCAHAHGERGDLYRRRTALGRGLAGWVAVHGEPLLANDVRADSRFDPAVDAPAGLPMHSVLCVPIQIRGKTVGVLEALNKRNESGFDQEDLSLMITTANQAAIAIETNQLYQSLREERDRIIQAQENVRHQVARNLHDGTVQFLSAISMGIDHMERLLQFKPEAARSELEALRDLTRQATQQARLALFELRPLILETQGLVPALETYVQQLQNSEDFDITLRADDSLPHLNNSLAATVFAIVQEAVNNAKKHADPSKVWLRLSREDNMLQVVVQDNGTGFELETVEREYDRRGSIGLLSMRERADLIDGVVEIQSSTEDPHAGTSIVLRVPLPSAANSAAT